MPRAGRFGTPSAPAAAGGGATDHGALTGLGDDDHPQYETAAEAAAQVAAHAAASDPHAEYLKEAAAAAIATSGSASDLATGTLPIARIADAAVTLAKIANVATARILGRLTASSGVTEELTQAQARSVLGMPALGAALAANVITSEGTTSTTYAELATTGPTLTATIGPSGMALVFVSANMSNGTASDGAIASVSVGGVAADDDDGAGVTASAAAGAQLQVRATRACLFSGLTPGAVVFLMKYRAVTGGTATFSRRRLVVVPLS